MAKWTSTERIDIAWHGYHFVGDAGTEFGVDDFLIEELAAEFGPVVPGFEVTEYYHTHGAGTHTHNDFVATAGDTMTGPLVVQDTITSDDEVIANYFVAQNAGSEASYRVTATGDHAKIVTTGHAELRTPGGAFADLRMKDLYVSEGIGFGNPPNYTAAIYRDGPSGLETDGALNVVGALTQDGDAVSLVGHTHPYLGTEWLTGEGVPSNSIGSNHDFYINTLNSDFYEKTAGVWALAGTLGFVGETGPQGEVGPTGPTGATGAGLSILGTLALIANLPASADEGDAYIVEQNGHLYIWTAGEWADAGQIQGPSGVVSVQSPITNIGTTTEAIIGVNVGITAGSVAAGDHTHTTTGSVTVLSEYVKNDATPKVKGNAVYISSANGGNVIVSYADADSEATSSKTLGLLAQNLSANQHGYVVTNGLLENVDTSLATAEGDSVWLSSTAGGIVFGAPPAEPAHAVYLGLVAKKNASTGVILVKVQNGYEIDELHDVSAASPTDGNLLQYKSATGLWTKTGITAAGILPLTGGTLTGSLTLAAAPTADLQAATKAYVDNMASNMNFHQAVELATTANLTATYSNGASGVGATLTNSGTQVALTIDGVAAVSGARVLVKNQTTSLQNGIYTVTDIGSGATNWVLTRATDADNSPAGEFKYGDFCFVLQGTNEGFGFINTSAANPIVIGTSAVTYTTFSAGKTVSAGNGLTEATPGVLSIDTSITQARVANVSDTEIGYLDGVTSAIQTQIDSKAATSHTHALSALTQSSATTNQVTVWNGTAWVAADAPLANVLPSLQTSVTTYTAVTGDLGKMIEMNHTLANTVSITSALNSLPLGAQIYVLQIGIGQTTVAAGASVTVNSTPGLKLRAQWSALTLVKRTATGVSPAVWVAFGDTVA